MPEETDEIRGSQTFQDVWGMGSEIFVNRSIQEADKVNLGDALSNAVSGSLGHEG